MQIAKNREGDSRKKERLEARTTSRIKRLIEQAAELEGRSVSDFMIEHAQDAAVDVIERHSYIKLSARNSARFVETLLNPPAPNKKLKRAARIYKDRIAGK